MILFLLGCSGPQWPTDPPPEPCAAGAIGPEERTMRIDVGTAHRQAIVYFPEGPGPHDVVVSLHEHNSNPRQQGQYTKWIDQARENNAIFVGPDGKAATWNAGFCCGRARDARADDIAFLDAVVKRVDDVGCTSGNVLATGIGAGAMMAESWACMSNTPDVVVSVGGVVQIDPPCERTNPLALLHYHGVDDQWMPADGSGGHMSLDHAVDLWTKTLHLTEGAHETAGALDCRTFTGDGPVKTCMVSGMADSWPGAADAEGLAGPNGTTLDATKDGWAFAVASPGWKR